MTEDQLKEMRLQLLGSLLLFTKEFYFRRTGREFIISQPIGRESHHITICRELTKVKNGQTKRLIINVPPRYGKTELLIHFVAWTMAHFPDSNYLYISYSVGLSRKQTKTVLDIIRSPFYKKLFGVVIREDVSAQHNFENEHGGTVWAAGSGGEITGRGAGIHGAKRWGGCICIDDIHKPIDIHSESHRETIRDWFSNTLSSRTNDASTPIVIIGQRLHEDDLINSLIESGDWEVLIIPALDAAGNALDPTKHTVADLKKMQEKEPYRFASQYQQNPSPAGGAIYKEEWFVRLEEEPEMLATFIVVDSAETLKNYSDASAFTFFGIYRIIERGIEADVYGLHVLNSREVWVEPKDLEIEFLEFYTDCMRFSVQPKLALVEKRSTGATLLSVLQSLRGLRVIDAQPKNKEGRLLVMSKTDRFLETQPYVAAKQISLPAYGKHTNPFIKHMGKITANDTHARDDIADTLAYAVRAAFIDKIVLSQIVSPEKDDKLATQIMSNFLQNKALRSSYGNRPRT